MTSENALFSGVEDVRRRLMTTDEFRHVWRESAEQQRLDFWVMLHLIAEAPDNFTRVYRHPRVWQHIGHCDTCKCNPVFITECEYCGTNMTSVGKQPNRWCSSQCRTDWRATAAGRMAEAAILRG